MLYFGKSLIKITIGRRFFPTKQTQREFTLIVQYPGTTQYRVFSQLKKSDGSAQAKTRDQRGRKTSTRLQKPQRPGHVLHFGTGDRVRVVARWQDMTSAPGLAYELQKRQAIL